MQNVIERILNLLAFLLTVDRPVTADEIRTTVSGYGQGSDEAWRRMFERDKGLLRDLGIPLRLEPTDAWEVEHGYVVSADDYALPDPGLTDEERAALWLAAQVVRIGGSPAGPEALFKLGGAPLAVSGEPLAADLGTQERELATVFAAVSERRLLTFGYRARPRSVMPYGLVHRRGHWYVVGPEAADASLVKAYRLDRMDALSVGAESGAFARPPGFRAADAIPDAPWEAGPEDERARVRIDAELAWWAERQLTGQAVITRLDDGGIEADLAVRNPEALIGWLLAFDEHAELLEPPELRRRLIERVQA
jgi:predicted DNA-binding transcriptional regulator YafY